jgi:biotin operon repressor
MSFTAISWAIKQRTGDRGSKLILILLANYSDDMGLCFPSQEHLALISHMSRRSVIRHIKTLNKKGLIQIQRISNGKKVNNRYILPLTKVPKTTSPSAKLSQNTNINTFGKKRGKNKNFIAG